jgi:hypothetical protein
MTKIAVISNPYNPTAAYPMYVNIYDKNIGSFWTDPWHDIKKTYKNLEHQVEDVADSIKKAYQSVAHWTTKEWNSLKDFTNEQVQVFKVWITNKWHAVLDTLPVIWHWIKKLFPLTLIMRNSFLLVVKYNVFNWGRKMFHANTISPQKVQLWWESLGGDYDSLKKAFEDGKNHKMIGVEPATITAIAAAASGVIASAVLLIKAFKGDSDNKPNAQQNADFSKGADDVKTALENLKKNLTTPPPVPPTPPAQTAPASPVIPLAAAGLLLLKLL